MNSHEHNPNYEIYDTARERWNQLETAVALVEQSLANDVSFAQEDV